MTGTLLFCYKGSAMLHDSEDAGQYLPPHTPHTHTCILYIPSLTRCLRLLIAQVTWFSDVPYRWCECSTLSAHPPLCTRRHSPQLHCTVCLASFMSKMTYDPYGPGALLTCTDSDTVFSVGPVQRIRLCICIDSLTETQCPVSSFLTLQMKPFKNVTSIF